MIRMQTRKLGPFDVSDHRLGLHEPVSRLRHAARRRCRGRRAAARRSISATRTSTRAALYGFGANETLIGRRAEATAGSEFVLATKGGMFRNAQGQREIDGRPEMIRQNCEESLQRLQTDVIDLYYLHRWDKRVPVEESVGALAGPGEGRQGQDDRPVSEVSATTIRKAHRRASDHRGADRVLAVDAQRRGRGARHLPRARHRLRRLQPAGARLPDRRSCATSRRCRRRTSVSAMPRFQARALREEPLAARRAVRASPASRAARWAARARLGARAGPAHHPDSGDDAARSSRGERARASSVASVAQPRSQTG